MTFQTTFRVMMADRTLSAENLGHGLSPTPDGVESPCGLCIRVPAANVGDATELLAEKRIVWEQIYRRSAGGWESYEPDGAG